MELILHAWHAGHVGGWWFPGLLFPLLWVGLIALLVWRRPWRRWEHRGGLAVLQERYARGEIDRREYEERRQVLEGR